MTRRAHLEKNKKRWSDLTDEQRAGVMVAGSVQMALLATALTDLWRRPSRQVNGDKRIWAAVSFLNFVGPLAYFMFGRKR